MQKTRPDVASPHTVSEYDEAVWHARRIAQEARQVEPLHERIRLMAAISDLLWKKDAPYARQLLLQAFNTLQDSKKSDEVLGGEFAIPDPEKLRQAIINVAARHEQSLGRQLMEKIEQPETDASNNTSNRRSPEELSKLLLMSAAKAIDTDEKGAQSMYAQSVFHRATPEHCYFLFKIQEKSPEKADRFFAEALGALAKRPLSESNEAMIFASYLFSREKSINYSLVERYNAANVNGGLSGSPRDPALAKQFLMLVQSHLNVSEAISPSLVYFALKNLLPQFQTFAPSIVPQVNAKMASLLQDVSRKELELNQESSIATSESPQARSEHLEERVRDADKIKNAGRRDLEYFTALQELYLPKNDFAGAYRTVNLVSDADLRQRLTDYVDFVAARDATLKRRASVDQPSIRKLGSPLLKTLLLCEIASTLVEDKKSAEAVEMLQWAETESRAVRDTQERMQARLLIAQMYLKLDRAVSFEILRGVLGEAEKAAGVDLRKSRIRYAVTVFGLKSELPVNHPPVNLFSLMASMGRENLNETLLICDQLKGTERLWATLAAIRYQLESPAPRTAN
ncbi:MAG TPA: hypothetical protein VM934_03640 [Pyrinomonadaceae bacterium]|nr:hypothetical protein [Pyrinomonadaceae bacterium]